MLEWFCTRGKETEGVAVNARGPVRGNNEDNFYFNGSYMRRENLDEGAYVKGICADGLQLYAVCDGMGGEDSGEEASHTVVRELSALEPLREELTDGAELTGLLRTISAKIHEEAASREESSGTTIALMLLHNGLVTLANVGDSRIYRFRDGMLTQLSRDHTQAQKLVSMGLMTPGQAKTDPVRHRLTQYLGMPETEMLCPYIVEDLHIKKEDLFLLCSDGLTDMVEDEQIGAILRKADGLSEAAKELLKAALSNGGRDNVTIMLLCCGKAKRSKTLWGTVGRWK